MARKVSKELAHVDYAIEVWARHVMGGLSHLGWPKRTLLARLIDQGPTGAAHVAGGAPVDSWPELVLIFERGVLRLKQIERKVLITHAFYNQPPEVSARYCCMSYGRYRTILHRVRRDLAAYLDGSSIVTTVAPRYLHRGKNDQQGPPPAPGDNLARSDAA